MIRNSVLPIQYHLSMTCTYTQPSKLIIGGDDNNVVCLIVSLLAYISQLSSRRHTRKLATICEDEDEEKDEDKLKGSGKHKHLPWIIYRLILG